MQTSIIYELKILLHSVLLSEDQNESKNTVFKPIKKPLSVKSKTRRKLSIILSTNKKCSIS